MEVTNKEKEDMLKTMGLAS